MRRNLRRPSALPLVAGLTAIVALLVATVGVASAHPGHAAPPPHADHDHQSQHHHPGHGGNPRHGGEHSIDAGQGLSGLPGNVLQMTGDPAELIDPSKLPVDPTTCKPVYPHEYLRVNTIFEVAEENGLRTAWVDKHPAPPPTLS